MSLFIVILIFVLSIGLVIWCHQYVHDREKLNKNNLSTLDEGNIDLHTQLYNQYLDLGSQMSNTSLGINQNNNRIRSLENLRSDSVTVLNTLSNEVIAKFQGLRTDYMSVQDLDNISSEIEKQRSLFANSKQYQRQLSNMAVDINNLQKDSKTISENVFMLNNWIIPAIDTNLSTFGYELDSVIKVYSGLSNANADLVSQFTKVPFQKFNDIGKLVSKTTCESLEKRVKIFADTVDTMQFAYKDIQSDHQHLNTVKEKVSTLSNLVSKYPKHYDNVVGDLKKQVGDFDPIKTKAFLDQPILKHIHNAFGGTASQDYDRFHRNYTELANLPEWVLETTRVIQRSKSLQDVYKDNVILFKERTKNRAQDLQQITKLKGEIEELGLNIVHAPANKVLVSNATTQVRTNKTNIRQNLCLKTGPSDTVCISNEDLKTILQGPLEFDPLKNCQQIYLGKHPFLEDSMGRKMVLDENKTDSKKGIVTLTGPTGKKVFQFTRDYFPDSWACSVDNKNGVVAVYVPLIRN